MRLQFGIILLLFVICLSVQETLDFNPYEVLDVGRSASTAEIRTVYKKLAREWHPDKNKSPNAQEKFIQIQQAYEILSDENKREQYDTGGYSGDSVGQWHHHSEPFNFRYSDFTQDFFNSHGSTRTISLHDYYNRVLPESHRTPHLIYVYSTFCAQCILWLRTTWQKAASDLENLGVSVYTVDTTFTSRIASSLGVTRVPTIVGMYKERVYYFKGQISKEELKFFVTSFLPADVIAQVTSVNVQEFLSGIESDDKPRAMLFSDKSSPTLLYRLMAVKYQKYIKSGYVNMRDKNSASVIKTFAVSQHGPTLLVFKDNLGSPAVVLGASEMPRGAINEIFSANKFVIVPRLTSQDVFDEVCLAPHGAVHTVRLCMILISDPSYEDHRTASLTLKKLVEEAESKEDGLSEWLKFMQVYTSTQPAFASSLLSSEINKPQLLLLWRRGQKMSSLLHLNGDFLLSSLTTARQEFQVCLRKALEAAHLQRFQTTVNLSPLVDELAPFLPLRILQGMIEAAENVYKFVEKLSDRHFMTVVMFTVLTIIMIHTCVTTHSPLTGDDQERSEEMNEQDMGQPTEDTRSDNSERDSKEHAPDSSSNFVNSETSSETTRGSSPKKEENWIPNKFMKELVPSLYEASVLRQDRGHMTVILLLDSEAPYGCYLMQEYKAAVKSFLRDPKITVTYLDIRFYSSWYREIRLASSAEPPGDSGDATASAGMSSLHSNGDFDKIEGSGGRAPESLAQACGTVLALNGARHWYCIFVPRKIKWGPKKSKNSSGNPAQSSDEETYTEALSCWMDRVREGQMPRLYVRQWPGLYVHSREEEEDDF